MGTVIHEANGTTTSCSISTDRFWLSLYSRYRFNKSFFRFFSHADARVPVLAAFHLILFIAHVNMVFD